MGRKSAGTADGEQSLVMRRARVVPSRDDVGAGNRAVPIDRHRLEATFQVLGTDSSEVVFQVKSGAVHPTDSQVRVSQWALKSINMSTRERRSSQAGHLGVASAFVVTMEVERKSFFAVRLIVLPLALIVALSWTVFWMERSKGVVP